MNKVLFKALYKSFIILLFCITPLHAGNQMKDVLKYINERQNAIQKLELAGDYDEAIIIANNTQEKLSKMGLSQNAQKFLETKKRLEEKRHVPK